MRHEAWLLLEEGECRDCALSDISPFGARIIISDAKTLPDNFLLLLTANGSARRRCRVIWRTAGELGVKFETRLDDCMRAALPPKADAPDRVKVSEPAESDG
jgi:hypothetical protein